MVEVISNSENSRYFNIKFILITIALIILKIKIRLNLYICTTLI